MNQKKLMVMIKPKHSLNILRSFLFLGGLSIATVLSVGLLEVETAQAGCAWLDVTCKDSGSRQTGRDIDPTKHIPGSAEFVENQWGNAGGAGYPAAAKSMRANNGGSQGLDENQKKYLRPHFGSLVDQVVVIYNANLLDEWSARGIKIKQTGSGGQTFCNRIYLNDPYQPNNSDQLVLLAHELVHSRQCQQLGGEGKFGFHYFREYKRAGQNYENNKLEKEAYTFVASIAPPPASRNDVPDNGVPNFLISTPGSPVVAVFSERGESFALGCSEIGNMWGKVSHEKINSEEYNEVLTSYPVVADLRCDGSIKAYAPTNEPGALLIQYRNGDYYRHYIDSLEFLGALRSGDLISIDVSEFRARFPERGTDFKAFR